MDGSSSIILKNGKKVKFNHLNGNGVEYNGGLLHRNNELSYAFSEFVDEFYQDKKEEHNCEEDN